MQGRRSTYSLSLFIVKFQELQAAVFLQGSIEVPHAVVHFGNDCVVSESLAAHKTQSNTRHVKYVKYIINSIGTARFKKV